MTLTKSMVTGFRSYSQKKSGLAEPHFKTTWYIKIKQKLKYKIYKTDVLARNG